MKTWMRTAAATLAAVMLTACAAGCQQEEPASSGGGSSSKPSSAAAENLNPKGYDFGGETVTIASTYIKLADMVPGKNNDTDRLLDRISEVEQAFHVNVEFKEVDQGTYWDNMATTIMAGPRSAT